VPLVDLLVETGLSPSRGRARTTVDQGGAYVNNRRETDAGRTLRTDDLVAGRYLVLRSGKKNYHLVSFG
jgi:tyrosyl-tRNA synthetase